MVEIYTIQISNWRKAESKGIHLLDITAKSGFKEFAPDYDKVMMYKRGEMNSELYSTYYTLKMRDSYVRYKERWNKLEKHSKIAFACYCSKNVFCHRLLFKEMVKKHFDKINVQYLDYGEIE